MSQQDTQASDVNSIDINTLNSNTYRITVSITDDNKQVFNIDKTAKVSDLLNAVLSKNSTYSVGLLYVSGLFSHDFLFRQLRGEESLIQLRNYFGSYELIFHGGLKALDGKRFPVCIKTLTGLSFNVYAHAEETVEEVKKDIHWVYGPSPLGQRMMFAGQQLEDKRTIGSYNVSKNNCTLRLVLRLRGD